MDFYVFGPKAPSGAQMLVSGAFRRQKPAFTTLTARKLVKIPKHSWKPFKKIPKNSWKFFKKDAFEQLEAF